MKDIFRIKESKWNILSIFAFIFVSLFAISYLLIFFLLPTLRGVYYYSFWPMTVPLIIVGIIITYIFFIPKIESKWLVLIALFLIAFVPRIIWVLMSPTEQESDFRTYLSLAQRALDGDFSWTKGNGAISFYFSYFLSLFGRIFGLNAMSATIMNAVVSALLAPVFYLIGVHIIEDKKIGILAGIMVAFFPSYVFFNALVGNQVLSTTLGYTAILFCLLSVKKNSIPFAVLGGVFLALAEVIRNADTFVLIIAVFIFIVIYTLKRVNKKTLATNFKQVVLMLLPIITIWISYVAVSGGIELYVRSTGKYLYDEKNAYNSYLFYHIVGGQNIETIGKLSEEMNIAFKSLSEDEFREYAINRIKESIKDPGYIDMHIKKFANSWMIGYTQWIGRGDNVSSEFNRYLRVIYTLERGYLFVMATLLFTSLFCFFKKSIDHFMYFCTIALAGNFLLIFLVVRNYRYRYFAEGIIILLAAFGLNLLISNREKIFNKLLKRKNKKET